MRHFLSIFACAFSLLHGVENSPLKDFPNTIEEVAQYTDSTIQEFDKQFAEYLKQPLHSLDYNTVVTQWEKMIEPLFTKGVILSFLPLTTQNLEVLKIANSQSKLLEQKLWMSMHDEKAHSLFLHFIKDPVNQKAMNPYEIYKVDRILEKMTESSLQEEVLSVQKELSQYKTASFLFNEGHLPPKKSLKKDTLTLLSWNVCLLESNISMLFGGVLPWEERIDRITSKIKELDADVLCLQEVFSSAASQRLVQSLASNYTYFYYDIGPNPVGFSIESLGIPSGLFVASKYPLKETHFTPYSKNETPSCRAYGFFTANIYIDKKPLIHLITTHLQPGSLEIDKKYRNLQISALSNTKKSAGLPTFICGDFNILKDSEEAKTLFSSYEPSDYTGINWTCCELRDYWWKAKQSVEAFKALPPDKEWLDYVFYLKGSSKKIPRFSTQIVEVNDLNYPSKALSDHQILFTTLILTE